MINQKVEKLPISKQIIFAFGQFGWSLAAFSGANALTFFYMPPENAEQALFPAYIFQGAVFGIATIIGLINAGSRVFDAITDPWIANLSDRSTSKFGKRRLFMGIAAFPFALFSLLIFVPIVPHESVWNTIWLIFTILLYYLSVTAYCTPYNALISELGHTSKERLNISTLISITWALGFALGNQLYVFRTIVADKFELSNTASFQLVLAFFAIIAFVFMMLPVLFIKEKKYAESHTTDEGVFQSVRAAFKNKNFLSFTLSDFMYWLSLTFIQVGISYFIIVLLKLDESLISFLMLLMFVLSFVFYVPVNLVARKFGKKKLLIFAFALFGFVFVLAALFNKLPFSPELQAYTVIALASIPLAVFGILPNAVIADLAEADGIKTGKYKAGTFFAARTFMMKMGISVANLIFPSFLLLGKSTMNDTGIRLAAISAIIFCIVGLLLLLKYNEKEIQLTLKNKSKQ